MTAEYIQFTITLSNGKGGRFIFEHNLYPVMSDQKNREKVNPVFKVSDSFRIESLFGSKTRVRLLNLFLEHPDRRFYVREITRKIDAQLNSVRRELQNLIDLGIFKEVEGKIIETEREDSEAVEKKSEKKKYYVANTDCPFFEDLRAIMKKSAVMMNSTLVKRLRALGRLDLLVLTGRFIDNQDVATDVLIVGEINPEQIQTAIEDFEKELGCEINYTYMPRDEYRYRSEVKDRFLLSLLESENVVLVNDLSVNL